MRRRLDAWNDKIDELLPDPLPRRLASAYTPRGSHILLDYGCGSADFLNRARHDGWKTIGVDISERVLDEVRKSGHLALPASPDAWDDVADASVAMARMNHVIEHLYAPREVLAGLFHKLEWGGTIHIATPNPRSLASGLLRSRWLGLDCPRHVLLYPPRVLAALLEETGFRTVAVFHEVLTKDYARSLGNVLHDLGRIEHTEILAMADRAGLDTVLRLPARLAAKAGVSDRFHCFATK